MADGRGPAGGDPCERKSLQEIVKDATWQELSQYPDDTVSAAEIKAMLDNRASRRRSRRIRGFGAAALFVLVIAAALFAYNTIAEDVEADKNAPEEIVTEDGVVIEDGGWGSSSEDMLVINDWDEVLLLKEDIDILLVPYYVPDGFVFSEFRIEFLENDNFSCIFLFCGEESILEIHETAFSYGATSFNINGNSNKLKCSKGDIYVKGEGKNRNAIIQMNNSVIVQVWGDLNDDEFIKIISFLES